jgi:hypothetical protein
MPPSLTAPFDRPPASGAAKSKPASVGLDYDPRAIPFAMDFETHFACSRETGDSTRSVRRSELCHVGTSSWLPINAPKSFSTW